MTALLLGGLVVVAIYFLLKWYADADVKAVKSSVKWIGVTILLLGILVLAATGRLGAAFAVLMAFFAWAWRIFNMVSMARQFGGMFHSFGFGRGVGAGASSGNSQVTSAFLAMHLDLSSGAMDGEVTAGSKAGRQLSALSLAELLDLLQEVQSDADSAQLLEAYLDRAHPAWRDDAGAPGTGSAAPPAAGAMTPAEAYRILGLADGASESEVKTAYRRLMGQLHPDRGGSDYLAAKVNQAKDLLLKHARS